MGIKELSLCGNIIDNGWIENLRYSNGAPNLNAVMILSEIIYWYKPTEIRSEITGDILGYKKKFKADKLQKSYGALGKRFGFSKRQVKDACDFLKNLGLITVEFRVIQVEHRNISNVMFVEPVLENIKKITGINRVADDTELVANNNQDIPPYKTLNNTNKLTASQVIPPPTIERNIPYADENLHHTETNDIPPPLTIERNIPYVQTCHTLHPNVGSPTLERKTYTEITTEITTKEPPPTSSITPLTKSEEAALNLDAVLESDENQNTPTDIKKKRHKNQNTATIPWNEIVALYHEHCPSLPRVLKVTDARKKQIAARWKDNEGLDVFADFFKRIEKSDFLTNRSSTNRNGWICTFDWALNDQNMTKVLEGRYDNKVSVPVQTLTEPQYSGWGHNVPDYVRQIVERSTQYKEG